MVPKSTKRPAHKRAVDDGRPARIEGYAQALLRALNKNETLSPAQLLGSDGMAIKIRGVISTQCETLDGAIGRGGIPLGRTSVLHGLEGSGKTTIALHCVAEAQKRGGMAVYLDTEYKLDRDYAKGIGVDIDQLVVVQPPHLEATFEIMDQIIQLSKQYRQQGVVLPMLIVLDSIDSTKAKAVIDGGWDDQFVAAEPRVWSDKFPKLIPSLSREDVALLLISQIRAKVGVMFGKKDKTSGGNAPRFYCSLLMGVERTGALKTSRGDEVIGNETRVFIGKNQIAPPFRSAEFTIMYGTGIDYEDSLMREVLRRGAIEQNGAWYVVDGEKYQGADNLLKAIRNSDALKDKLRETVRAQGKATK
jgi:recombination protein RecA